MIKLKPGFHMIATTAVIAVIAAIAAIPAIAEKKKTSAIAATIYNYHMKPVYSDRSDNLQQSLRYKKFYLSDRYRCDRWRVVSI